MKKKKFLQKKYTRKYLFFQKTLENFLFPQKNSSMVQDLETKKQTFSENCSIQLNTLSPFSMVEKKKISHALRNFTDASLETQAANFSTKPSRKFQKQQTLNFENFFQKQKSQRFFLKKQKNSLYSKSDFFQESFFSGSIFSRNAGKFFPLKKDFMQYWGFPLVGFVFFFFLPNSEKSPVNYQNFFIFFNKTASRENTGLFEEKATPQGFSFCEKNISTELQNFEKNEFEKFSNYYFESFQKSFRTISTHQTPFQKLQSQVLENWKLESLKLNSFRNQMQNQKKTFSLKWHFLPFENKTTSIPDQAQFFEHLKNDQSFPEKFWKETLSMSSPLWNFSQLRFLVNESQRNGVLSVPSETDHYVQNFLKTLKEENFQFFEFLFNSQKTEHSFQPSSDLQKWLQTQNLTKIKTISLERQKEKNSSAFLPTFQEKFTNKHLTSLDALFLKKYFEKSAHNCSFLTPIQTNLKKTSPMKSSFFQKQSFSFKTQTFQSYAFLSSKKKFQKIPFFLQIQKNSDKKEILNSQNSALEKMFSFVFSTSQRKNLKNFHFVSQKQKNFHFVEKESKKVAELDIPVLFHFSKEWSSKTKNGIWQLHQNRQSEKLPKFFQQTSSFLSQTSTSSEYFQFKQQNSPPLFSNFSQFFRNFSFLHKQNFSFTAKNRDEISKEPFFFISNKFSKNFVEILLQKLQPHNLFQLKYFQNSFFFEKSHQKDPFIFSTSQVFQEQIRKFQSQSEHFLFSLTPKQKIFLSETGSCFQGKLKKKSPSVLKPNFRGKKFEKVFRTFFLSSQKKNEFLLSRKEKNRNDKLLLNIFSTNFQQHPAPFSKKVFSQKLLKKERCLPTNLLKRDAFVFHVWFPQSLSSFQMDERTHTRIEKEKSFQRKRRLKKQKLETRRRKKRKRFFPRPIWLRFQLYKKFLKIRHPEQKVQNFSVSKKDLKVQKFPVFSKNMKKFFFLVPKASSDKFLKKLGVFPVFENSFVFAQRKPKKLSVSQKIFKTNTQKWGFYWKSGFHQKIFYKKFNFDKNVFCEPSSFSGFQKSPISQRSDDYKISRSIFTDFLRFSWKSSWFQSNFPILQNQISKNFKKMKHIESDKNSLNSFGISLFGDRNSLNILQAGSVFQQTPPVFENESFSKNLASQKFSWYWNIQNTSSEQSIYENFFSGDLHHMEQVQNLSEYNRFLYSRLSEFFKSMKSQEFFENSSSLSQNKSKFPVRKNENFLANSSFFTKVALFKENFQIPSQPYFPAFSLFSSLFQNTSFKAFGEFPTLRSLWAFHQTNFFQFQEQNSVRSRWTEKKRIESLKSLKGAKQGMKFIKRFSESTAFQPFDFFAEKNQFLLENGVKNRFLSSLKPESQKYFSKLDNLSLKKFQTMEEKCSVFGIQSLKENSKLSSRYLKFQLLSKKSRNFSDSNISFLNKATILGQKKPLPKNSAKSSLNFWWSSKRMENFSIFSPFSFFVPCQEFSSSNQYFGVLQTQFLWFAALSFHLAIFFTFFKLPEIRSLFKFQLLIFLKFSHAFFSILFAGSNFFKISSLKGKQTATKFGNFCSSFEAQNSLTFSSSNFWSNSSFSLASKKTKGNESSSETFQSFFVPFFSVYVQKKRNSFVPVESQKDILFQAVFRVSDFSSFPQEKIFKKNIFLQKRNSSSLLQRFSIAQTSTIQKNDLLVLMKQNEQNSSSSLKNKLKTKTRFLKNQNSISELFLSQFSLLLLVGGKSFTKGSSKTFELGSIISTKILDSFESVLVSFYKFLEKPAELIIEWIALIFLVEWSSDMLTFVPDTLDTSLNLTTKKFSRSLRFAPFFLYYSSGNLLLNFQNLLAINTTSFFYQKQVRSLFEQFSSVLTQPDIDILVRQRKGMIFWDIWAEILLKTAEKYNVNIPSFVTLKEEQELFLEKLLQDQQFLESLQGQYKQKGNQKENNTDLLQQKSLASYMQNFLIPGRPNQFPQSQKNFANSVSEYSILKQNFTNFQLHQNASSLSPFFQEFNQDRWSAQQYVTYQGPESDLFVDIHPPVSFQHIPYFKYVDSAQPILGSLVCEIYGGLFSKQVSKNILVVGSQGTSKTVFLQALAGETEMKIITENASRYATVQNGVAVGMKYLRDVFDALSFQTPCFFVMENIHLLGAKRPLLISDDEKIKVLQPNFGMDQQEVHETNQMMYELMRHSISDFRRPFKGDFSLGIPTNFYIQNSSFSKEISPCVFPNTQFSEGGQNNFQRISPNSPFQLEQIEKSLISSDFTEKQQSGFFPTSKKSFLQFSKEETFAPPATSPFTILIMKEQKKLKPKKILSENSWGGFSADQLLSSQKDFVRSKVATLADLALNSSRKKFDMITDLLVILDSVRSNRGFVVFATTHLPSMLDPALRRPGRFDEILSLAQTSNFFTRFEILKTSFCSSVPTFDLVDASFGTENLSETNLGNLVQAAKFSLFQTSNFQPKFSFSLSSSPFSSQNQKKVLAHLSPISSFQNLSTTSTFADFYSQKKFLDSNSLQKKTNTTIQKKENQNSRFFLRNKKLHSFQILPKGPSHELILAYSKIGIFLGKSNILKDPTAFTPCFLENSGNIVQKQKKLIQSEAFSSSFQNSKYQLQVFLAGKVSESFLFSSSKTLPIPPRTEKGSQFSSQTFGEKIDIFEEKFCFSSVQNSTEILPQKTFQVDLEKSRRSLMSFNFWSAFGGDSTWRNAMPFLSFILQKRFLFTKNSLLSKMLFFENRTQQKQPPSPPNSTVCMPAKKYEQFKRTEVDFTKKGHFSMNQKIQMHQQQKFLKQLYNIPQQQDLFSEKFSQKKNLGSFQELAFLDSLTLRVTSSHFYYKKYFVQRHRFSHLNQWWNGFFPEHTAEATFLSDVDWRTMFGTSLQPEKSNLAGSSNMKKSSNFEFSMDFPDAEQYYNPRNRRWYFESQQNVSKWFSFDVHLQYEIYFHCFFSVFSETFAYFDENREYLDFSAFQFLQKGFLSELDYLTTKTRFENQTKIST